MEGTELLSVDRAASPPLGVWLVLLPFENIAARLQEAHRVEGLTGISYLEMDMRSRTAAGAAELADDLPIIHDIADLHVDRVEVRVARDDAEPVVDFDHPAVAALPPGKNYRARSGRQYF